MGMRSTTSFISASSLRRVIIEGGVSKIPSIFPRCFSSDRGKGRVFDEEEKAKEKLYIQKMERERMEKLKHKMDKEHAGKEKEDAQKKSEGETRKD